MNMHLRSICRTYTMCCYSSTNYQPHYRFAYSFRKSLLSHRNPMISHTLKCSTEAKTVTCVKAKLSCTEKISTKAKLAKIIAEYGVIGGIFYGVLVITSLGICFTTVSCGVDVAGVLQKFDLVDMESPNMKMFAGVTTFAVAYAMHSVLLPLRIFITVTCTPLIVRNVKHIRIFNVFKKTS